ncbi:MAG: glycosyltransferase [Solirubrobacterales bacterium]
MSARGGDRPPGDDALAAPRFYADRLGQPFTPPEAAIARRFPGWIAALARRPGFAQGVALGVLARHSEAVALIRRDRGTLPALLVAGLPPARRRIFVLELLRRPLPLTAWRRVLYRIWWKLVETPALRRGMAAAQVMTDWERDEYAAHYGLDRRRLHVVRWALRAGGEPPPPEVRAGDRAVFASGRTACDWPTLFAAARGAGWELTVVCSRRDRAQVERLAAQTPARVLSELPETGHERLLRVAAVSAIVLEDRGLSAGQVRLMTSVSVGVPVVVTRIRSLEGYVAEGETAIFVPAGDPDRLRAEIDALLDDPARRERLRDAALRHAAHWTYDDYFGSLRRLILAPRGSSVSDAA